MGSGDGLGDTSKALESDQKAVGLLEPLSAQNRGDARVTQDLARGYLLVGCVLNLRGKADEGFAKLTQAAAIYDRLTAANPHDAATLVDAGRAYLGLGDAISGRGGRFVEMATRDQVLAAEDKAIGYFKSAVEISPHESGALLGLAQAYNQKGNILASTDVGSGPPIYQMGLDALRKVPPEARATANSQGLEARLLTMIAFCEVETGRFKEAIPTLQPAQEILDRLAAADPKNATNALRRVNLYRTRAFAYQYSEQYQNSSADFRKAIEILDGMIATDPAKQSNRMVRAELQGKLAQMLAKDGHMKEAAQATKAGQDYFKEIAERPDAAPQNLKEAASALITSPTPGLLDFPRALRYAQRADALAKGKDTGAIFYIAQC